MAEYHDLVQSLTWLLTHRLQSKSEYTRGLLGNGQGHVQVPDRDDFSYVRPDRHTTRVFEVFNKNVSGPDDLPVIIGELPWQPGLTQVICVDWDAYYGVGWGDNTPGIPRHGPTHEWRDGAPGVDAFNVYRRQMGELRTYPVGSGSMSVYVSPYNFTHMEDVKSWSGLPGLDLSGAMPGTTGTARMVLTYWDPCSGTSGYLGVATGTLGVDADPEVLNLPAAPAGTIPSAWVKLRGGQGSVTEFDVWDARPLWAPSIEFATGSCGIWAGLIPIADDGGLFTGTTVEQALQQAAGTSGPPSGPAGGDLTGSYPNPTVDGLLNRPLGLNAVAEGHILMYTGSAWQPISPTANPTAQVGLAAVNGVAPTFMAFDSAPALSQAIVPTWIGIHRFNENILQAAGKYIATSEVRAASAAGLTLYEDGGTKGILVADTGYVGIGCTPSDILEVSRQIGNETQGIRITNTQLGGYGSLISIYSRQNFGGNLQKEAGRIQVRGESNWASDAATDSYMRFMTILNATLTEWVRITAAGYVGIGMAPTYRLDVLTDDVGGFSGSFFNDGDNVNRYGIKVRGGDDTPATLGVTYFFYAFDGSDNPTGACATTNGVFSLWDVSDERRKANIKDTVLLGLGIVNDLRVRDFNWEANLEGPVMTSFVAQEARKVYPDMVGEFHDGTLGTSRGTLIPILTKAIQELSAENDEMRTRLDTLENLPLVA